MRFDDLDLPDKLRWALGQLEDWEQRILEQRMEGKTFVELADAKFCSHTAERHRFKQVRDRVLRLLKSPYYELTKGKPCPKRCDAPTWIRANDFAMVKGISK